MPQAENKVNSNGSTSAVKRIDTLRVFLLMMEAFFSICCCRCVTCTVAAAEFTAQSTKISEEESVSRVVDGVPVWVLSFYFFLCSLSLSSFLQQNKLLLKLMKNYFIREP